MVIKKVIEDNDFSHSSFLIAAYALDMVQERYGVGESPMAFHQFRHSLGVMQRTRKIMKIFIQAGIATYVDLCLATMAAAGHDVVQDFEALNKSPEGSEGASCGRVQRFRKVTENERQSALFIIENMRVYNKALEETVFTEEHERIIMDAVMGTIPAWHVAMKTVFQKALIPGCHVVSHAVMLADVGTAGWFPKAYVFEGDQLFKEEELGLQKVDFATLSKDAEEYWRGIMLGWCRGQVTFACGRRDLFESEIAWLPVDARVGLRGLFCHFDETIALQESVNAEREKMSTYQLWKTMGF